MSVALIVDKPGWAYFNIALQVKKRLKIDFEVDAEIIAIDKVSSWQTVVESLRTRFQHIHFFWRGATRSISESRGTTITTSVYDHHDFDYGWVWNPNNTNIRSYWFSSNKIKKAYADNGIGLGLPVLTDGVDTELFTPREQFRYRNGIRTIGWIGNPSWGASDHKGLHSIIKPALEPWIDRFGLNIRIIDGSTPHFNMPDVYKELDLVICASLSEGTPNPILEASATGVPWISTDVGVVGEIMPPTKDLLFDRNVVSLSEKLRDIFQLSTFDLSELGLSLRNNSFSWEWRNKAEKMGSFILQTGT
jgi:glycosyltransferase involved in cell wall biosynthesis